MDMEAGKTLTNEEVIRELLDLLKKNAMKEQANDVFEICSYVDGLEKKIDSMTEELTNMQNQIKEMQEDTLVNNAKKALSEAQEQLNARCEQIKSQVLVLEVKVQVKSTASMESVRKAFKEATEKYGCVDILVNNAGISENTSFMDYTEETFDKVIDLNVKGVFNTTRVAAECMVARGKGVILSTSSMVSISGQPSGVAYPASKFAVNGLTVSLARELGPKGIRVNAVAPGITETDMMKAVPKEVIEPMIERIPLRRLGQPEDIANAFVFLASDEASYITGVILSVDGMARS
ncbi:SDR family oxidoreductase [[Ruminococcus] lactaris]|nr:SDR family oxidoreductase [[Ruminococcus] lactaris]MCB5849834.1 SDR family oxidoreductase [[Ruminococcus] lactaris]